MIKELLCLNDHLGIMAKKILYRVELTPEAFSIIQAEAYLSGKSLKDIASNLVIDHCSKEALSMHELKSGKPKEQMIIKTEKQKSKKPKSETTKGAKTRKSKKKNPQVLQLIKEAWGRTPRPTLRKIADEIEASLGVKITHTSVKRYAEELGLQTEETEPETANVGE